MLCIVVSMLNLVQHQKHLDPLLKVQFQKLNQQSLLARFSFQLNLFARDKMVQLKIYCNFPKHWPWPARSRGAPPAPAEHPAPAEQPPLPRAPTLVVLLLLASTNHVTMSVPASLCPIALSAPVRSA